MTGSGVGRTSGAAVIATMLCVALASALICVQAQGWHQNENNRIRIERMERQIEMQNERIERQDRQIEAIVLDMAMSGLYDGRKE